MVHNIDCMDFLDKCDRFRTMIADIPDNIGLHYVDFVDKKSNYFEWIEQLIVKSLAKCDIFWLSYNQIHDIPLKAILFKLNLRPKQVIWRYNFGQYNDKGLSSGYRPILYFAGVPLNFDAIRVPSARQRLNDKRAVGPRVPDDVWEIPRVTGNSKQRRDWHPTQHPEDLIERILLLSGGPVCDLFLGSGTTLFVARKLGILCEGCEISPFYCQMIHALS